MAANSLPECLLRAPTSRPADFQTYGTKNIPLLTIRVVQQRNARRAVGIVFDRRTVAGTRTYRA